MYLGDEKWPGVTSKIQYLKIMLVANRTNGKRWFTTQRVATKLYIIQAIGRGSIYLGEAE
ncbi:hypothetical protein GL2_24610 [Microbulbifer sp. GL-2]|nr:hypothetical protein GL2_24610 [Microbulbifer sp. GL-2]